MGGNLIDNDHELLSKFLDAVLDRYKDGFLSHGSARSTLAEAITLASQADTSVTRHMQALLAESPREHMR